MNGEGNKQILPTADPKLPLRQRFSLKAVRKAFGKGQVGAPGTLREEDAVNSPTDDKVGQRILPDFNHPLDQNLADHADIDSNSSGGYKSDNTQGNQLRQRLSVTADNTQRNLEFQEDEHTPSTEAVVKAIKKRRLEKQIYQDADYDEDTPEKYQRGALAMVCVIAILFLAHLGAAIYLFLTPDPYEHPYTCMTGNCKRMAKWLTEAMDESKDPCDDFYLYTCGKYLAENPSVEPKGNLTPHFIDGIPYKYDGNEKLGMFLKPTKEYPFDQLLPFYKSCMFQKNRDEIGYKPLINLLSKLKLRYLHQYGSNRPSIARLMVRIYKMVGHMFLIEVNDVINNFITIRIPKPPEELRNADPGTYASTMRSAYKLFWNDFRIQDELHLDTIVYQVMSFEAELEIIQSRGNNKVLFGFPNDLNKYTKEPEREHPAFTYTTGGFRWDDFVDELFVRDSQDYWRKQNDSKPVILFNYLYSLTIPEDRIYLLVLEQFLWRTPMITLLYYFQWNIIKTFAFDLTTEFQDIMQSIFTTQGKSDVQRCFRSVFYNLNVLAAERYHREIEDVNQTIFQVNTLSKVIEEGLRDLSKILPRDIRNTVQDSLETIRVTNALFTSRSEHIATFYGGLLNQEDEYFANVVQARNIRARNEIYRLRKVYPYQDWPFGSYSLNHVQRVETQDDTANYRHFFTPFGSLDEPFVGNDLPAMDFGGIGFWILSYYTVLQTILDLLNRLRSERMSQESMEFVRDQKGMEMNLMPRFECIYNATSQLEMPQLPGIKLNPYGDGVRLKNLGDAIALEALSKIFELSKSNKYLFPEHQLLPGFEHYSPEQLFFHSLARHCCFVTPKSVLKYQMKNGPTPFHLRVVGSFRLNRLFSKSWSCPRESYMNAKQKCQFFVPHRKVTTSISGKGLPELDLPIKKFSGEEYADIDDFK